MSVSSPRILVVDDEADICRNLVDIFVDFGYCVDMANDGASALELVKKHRYDLAFLDLMMPGMDGATLYDEMKRVRSGTVVLIVTAYPGHPRAEAALHAGASKVLPKPVDIASLIQAIEKAVAQPLLLMVDDDRDYCTNLVDILRERNYRTCVARDVATANAFINADEGYHLILLDMRLPDGDGSEVVRMAHHKNPALPIIVVTGYRTEMEEQIPQLLLEGATAVLPKPLDVPALLLMLQEFTDDKPNAAKR
jgi:DNA-binding NtrC family response regulator